MRDAASVQTLKNNIISQKLREKAYLCKTRLATSNLRFYTVGLLFVGCIKDKFYVNKPHTNDALKDNIREVIDEIQLHTIDSVLKN